MAMPYYYQPNYQPFYNPYQQMQSQQAGQQPMTAPTIHADIIQVDNEQTGVNYPVGAGESQMMITKDEATIIIKTATKNGQPLLDVYDKRPPEPEKPAFNPSEYVRRDEIESIIATCMSNRTKHKPEKEDNNRGTV